jgi:hypothetical protein
VVSRTLGGHRARCLEVQPQNSGLKLGTLEERPSSSLPQHSKQCLFIVGYLVAVADDLIAPEIEPLSNSTHAAAAHFSHGRGHLRKFHAAWRWTNAEETGVRLRRAAAHISELAQLRTRPSCPSRLSNFPDSSTASLCGATAVAVVNRLRPTIRF